jgi:hypothetical protein
MFGNVMFVSYVTEKILIVVGSQGTVEIWDVRVEGEENFTNLIELSHLDRGEVTSVVELKHFDSELLTPEQLLAEETQAEEADPNDPFGEIKVWFCLQT